MLVGTFLVLRLVLLCVTAPGAEGCGPSRGPCPGAWPWNGQAPGVRVCDGCDGEGFEALMSAQMAQGVCSSRELWTEEEGARYGRKPRTWSQVVASQELSHLLVLM